MEESSRLGAFSHVKLLCHWQEGLTLIQWLHKDHLHEEYICQAKLHSRDNNFIIPRNCLVPPGICLCNGTSMVGQMMSFKKNCDLRLAKKIF